MIDLDRLFMINETGIRYRSLLYICGDYRLILWVGKDGNKISDPENAHLSLNDYSHFGIRVRYNGNIVNEEQMHEVFGFDLMGYPVAGKHCPGTGYMVPKQFLIMILQKFGVIPFIPEDAGDGED